MRSRVAIAVALLLVVGSLAPLFGGTAAATSAAGAVGDDSAPVPAAGGDAGGAAILAQEQPEANNTITRIEVHPNGSATWVIRFRTRLETDADVAEYEEFQAAFRNNTSRYLGPFRERMTGVVANANESTDRRMAATGFSAATSIQEVPRRWGVVRYEFTWHGFAAVEDDRVVVGDVFAGGFYIGDGDALKLAAPDGYVVTETAPEPDELGDGVAVWYGREDFADGQPRFVAAPADVATPADGGEGSTDDAGGDGADSDGGILGSGVLLGAVAVGLLAALGVAWRRGTLADARDAVAAAVATVGTGDAATESEGSQQSGEPGSGGAPATDPLVTDEDRVLDLLDERGGRIKQGEIAEALDWSKSKTSRVLSRMADADQIRKYQLGRENVIELPDEE
ncbi:MAG: helix-turn-helix transcriptional regulator [Halopenitus sp.]